jgi:hypothetical protein
MFSILYTENTSSSHPEVHRANKMSGSNFWALTLLISPSFFSAKLQISHTANFTNFTAS